MSDDCMAENCRYRYWRSGSMPTHKRGGHCPPQEEEMTDHKTPIGDQGAEQVQAFAERAARTQAAIDAAGLGRPEVLEYQGSQVPADTVRAVLDAVLAWQRAPFGHDSAEIDLLVTAAEQLELAL